MDFKRFDRKIRLYGSVISDLNRCLRIGQSIVIAASKIFGNETVNKLIDCDCFYADSKIDSYIYELYKLVGSEYEFPENTIKTLVEGQQATVESYVKEYLSCGGYVTGVYCNGDNLEYQLQGFAKSGEGILALNENGEVVLKTRYESIDKINSFDDIANVSDRWTDEYRGVYVRDKWAENYFNKKYDR